MVENEEEEEGRGGKLLLPFSFLPFLSFISPPFPFPFSRYTIISLPPFSFIPGYYFAELFSFPAGRGKAKVGQNILVCMAKKGSVPTMPGG